MLSENLQQLRKAKGLSQEELALQLNVVRQTLSKWEKGLSVPDAQMLIRIAEVLDTSVSDLLGEQAPAESQTELKLIAAKLELINEQLARQNERRRKLWRAVFIAVLVLAVLLLLRVVFSVALYLNITQTSTIIGGADGPTAILVASSLSKLWPIPLGLAALAVAIVGLCRTRRK